MLQLYDASNIDKLVWPETPDGQYAKAFLLPIVKNKISYYVHNIDADLYVLKLNDFILPILAVAENYSNSWVCSPYAHYIAYGKEYSAILGNSLISKMIKNLLIPYGKLCCLGKINSVVYVNNWFFSTDLYPEGLSTQYLDAITALLKKQFPEHAIILRSLNKITTPDLLASLEEKNYHLIASRYIFISDTLNESIFKTRILKSDLRLWKENSPCIVHDNELELSDCEQLLNLHQQLYILQRSPWQPQYNLSYMKLLFEKQLLKFKVYKSQGIIRGVAGYYKRGKVMMCPIFGYQKEDSSSGSIYRVLNTALLLEAQKEGLLFNQSAGASFFKSIRRAEGCLEYMAVYTDHLPLPRQMLWSSLLLFINKLGAKYMQKY